MIKYLIYILLFPIGVMAQSISFATVGVQDKSGIEVEVEHYVNYVPNHSIYSQTYSPQSTAGTSVSLGDDSNVGPFNIGFDFEFYGQIFSQFRICTNGFITFGSTSGRYSPGSFPSGSAPNGVVAAYWTDLYPSSGYYMRYQTTGTAPNRKLIVSAHLTYYSNRNAWVDYQIVLFEGTDKIWTTITSQGWTPSATQGVENHTGTLAATPPGRNLSSFNGTGTTFEYAPQAAIQQWESQGTQITSSTGIVSFSNPSNWDYRVNVNASNLQSTVSQNEMNYLMYMRMFPNEMSSWDFHTCEFNGDTIVGYEDVKEMWGHYESGDPITENAIYNQSEKDDIEVNATTFNYHTQYPRSDTRTFNNLNRFYIVTLGKHRRTINSKTITQ
jgi:hypothetical protein